MAWADPSTQVAGHLVTADEYNEIINNLKHLRGQDGTTVLEGDVDPDADETQNLGSTTKAWNEAWIKTLRGPDGVVLVDSDLDPNDDLTEAQGSFTKRWNEGHFHKLYASNGMRTLHGAVREESFDWPSLTRADWNIVAAGDADLANGDFDTGGTGQVVLWVKNDSVDGIYLGPKAEQNGAKDNSWNAGRSPYGRFAFNLSANHSDVSLWIGFRETLGNAVPVAAAENFAGLHWNGAVWIFMNANGAAQTVSGSQTVAANTRHVFEILIISATSVTYALDGTILHTSTTTLPTGNLDWTVMALSRNEAGAVTLYTTVGKLLFQESLA